MRDENKLPELTQLVETIGLQRSEDLLRVHRTTLKRWLNAQSRIPDAAVITLRAAAFGQMPGHKRERCWDGWYFADGKLWSPEDVWFEPGQLRALPYLKGEAEALRRQVEDLRAALAASRHAGQIRHPAANEAEGAQALIQEKIAAPWP